MSRLATCFRGGLGAHLPLGTPGALLRGVRASKGGVSVSLQRAFASAGPGPWRQRAGAAPGSLRVQGLEAGLRGAGPPPLPPLAAFASQSQGAVAAASRRAFVVRPKVPAAHLPHLASPEDASARRFRTWRNAEGEDHEEALGPTEAHMHFGIDQQSLLMEQVRSIWVVRNGAAGASLALGAVFSAVSHGSWDMLVFFADPHALELVLGPCVATSGTLVIFHGLRRAEDLCLKFTLEEREERAFSSKGPLGFATISLLAGLGCAVTSALIFGLEARRSGLGTHHKPIASFESFTVLY